MDVLQPALRKVVIDPVAVILMRFRDRREILQDLIDIWEPHPNLIQITESASVPTQTVTNASRRMNSLSRGPVCRLVEGRRARLGASDDQASMPERRSRACDQLIRG